MKTLTIAEQSFGEKNLNLLKFKLKCKYNSEYNKKN